MSSVTQLHRHLELLSEGDPPWHTLFVLEQEPGQPERLLLIDPPPDVAERFTLPPQVLTLAPGSDGTEELETLRLLARLVKERERLLYIPRTGSLSEDKVTVMTRLAEDVAYLHGLRRTIPGAVQRREELPAVQRASLALMPENRRTPLCAAIHRRNVATLFQAMGEMR